jgi:DedD protein
MTSDARTAHDAEEDGFHEIQLNGKQLVFLGMTTTLVSVVIFLCGVLVGRGVKPIEPVAEAASSSASASIQEVPPPPAEVPPAPVPESAPVAAAAPPPAPETVPPVSAQPQQSASATSRPAPVEKPSDDSAQPKSSSRPNSAAKRTASIPAPQTPAEPAGTAPAPAPAEAASADAPMAAGTSAAESPSPSTPIAPETKPIASTAETRGGAIAVQVAALTSRADAEAIARRLSGKGYAAYVLSPDPGAKPVFKVRVGNYASLDEAERVSRRLKQEEKLKPWVIR